MIRYVEPRDVAAITAIYNHYILNSTSTFEKAAVTEEEMHRRMEGIVGKYPYFVYETDGRVVGYCYAHQWKARTAYDNTWETTVYLDPDVTRHGIGRQLMEHLIATCRARGCRALIACITGGNEASFRLHEGLGFRRVSHFEQVGEKFGRLLDVMDYQLTLMTATDEAAQ